MDRLDHLTSESEKRVTDIERRVEILRHVLRRQIENKRTTKTDVIKHMKGMSSRETTHNLIKELRNEGKLNVEVLNSQVHFLTVKENYDLAQFERESLVKAITETHSYFEKIVLENEGLVSFVKEVIDNNDIRYVSTAWSTIPSLENLTPEAPSKQKPQRKTKTKDIYERRKRPVHSNREALV
jgi:hypothetical protein